MEPKVSKGLLNEMTQMYATAQEVLRPQIA